MSTVQSLTQLFCRGKLLLAVILLQFGYAGLSIIIKFALIQGMSHYILVAYRMAIATAVVTPFAIVFERKSRPKMTTSIFVKAMLLSFFDPVIDQNLYYIGMKYTTASFASSMCNILPSFAFIMAWIFKLEEVNICRLHSQAKILGTIVAVGGAMLMTLIRGPVLNLPWTKERNHHHHHQSAGAANKQDLMKGALLLIASCFSWCCFLVMQALILKSYPAKLSLTALICFLGMIESTIVALAFERGNPAVWFIHFDTKLLASLYGGILSGVAYYIMGMVIKERGPVYFSAFNPLSTVIVAILGSFILAEEMYLGRIIGAIVIVMGLYLVLWGKRKDQPASMSSSDDTTAPNEQMATLNENMEASSHDIVAIDVTSSKPKILHLERVLNH